MSQSLKRFWNDVAVAQEAEQLAFTVRLDGRAFRLPGGTTLTVSSRALAEAIAEEWRAIPAGATFRTSDLPMTQMAGTQIERIAPDRTQIIGGLAAYGDNDLLCYRASGSLGREQDALFDPVLDEFSRRHGVRPPVTRSLMPVTIEPALQQAYGCALKAMDDPGLACAAVCAPATGSLIIAIGLVQGWLLAEQALAMASVEERHQMAQWGEDDALIGEIERNGMDLAAALRFHALSHQSETKQA
ncbi:ATP12 family protein [Asaia krungthepensis]|uniref:ATP synthase F1 mitochondrial assembly chaperone ATP12 n=1 Tax=Asaia krungthepensis NRIC 0535 TaxID=1307925 RepID=A0ABQ0Q668_9PROT|nr:ATP12 family protein [Asaia krungthepensis]GBQ93182.1 ATP synthase F1 mitochondrial assembly chaperone ATP12 [Asaia krungthepensis NRIC 0535]